MGLLLEAYSAPPPAAHSTTSTLLQLLHLLQLARLEARRRSVKVQGGEERQSNMMREDARRQVVAQWPAWAKANNVEKGTGADALLFFNFLQDKRPDLLAFDGSDDKWQAVHGWLLNGRLVSD